MLQSNETDKCSAEYVDLLSDRLSFERLMENALEFEKEPPYTKVIKIDFCGLSGASLLVPEGEQKEIHKKFLALFENLEALEALKIKLQIRFIFLYAYSDFAFAQIEAENTLHRTTMSDDSYSSRHFDLHSLSLGEIQNSSIYRNQTRALNKIQDIHNKFFFDKRRSGILNIRFTCLPINFCLLKVNNEIFIDPYSYAKEDIKPRSLFYKMPLSYVVGNTKHFSAIEDHFRYIWNHPATMLFEDATAANIQKHYSGKLEGLSEIRQPGKVNFEVKAKLFKTELNATDEAVNVWKFRVEQLFNSMTRVVETAFEQETLFIGFGWTNGLAIAEDLAKLIEVDFRGSLRVVLGDLREAEVTLYHELTRKMRSATMGLIIFTKDIPVDENGLKTQFSRPNLYFEFGFLKRHLEKLEMSSPVPRTLILAETGLTTPTDLQDLTRFTLSKKLIIDYYPILCRLIKLHKMLSKETAINALENYKNNLQNAFLRGDITKNDIGSDDFFAYVKEKENKLRDLIKTKFVEHNRLKNK